MGKESIHFGNPQKESANVFVFGALLCPFWESQKGKRRCFCVCAPKRSGPSENRAKIQFIPNTQPINMSSNTQRRSPRLLAAKARVLEVEEKRKDAKMKRMVKIGWIVTGVSATKAGLEMKQKLRALVDTDSDGESDSEEEEKKPKSTTPSTLDWEWLAGELPEYFC